MGKFLPMLGSLGTSIASIVATGGTNVFGWIKLAMTIIKAIPALVAAYKQWELEMNKHTQDQVIKDKLQKVADGYATGDTRKIEEAFGQTPGLPSQHQDGVQTRPGHIDEE